jgi:hypothetical protein
MQALKWQARGDRLPQSGAEVRNEWSFSLFWNVMQCRLLVTSQKRGDIIYTASEAWNHARIGAVRVLHLSVGTGTLYLLTRTRIQYLQFWERSPLFTDSEILVSGLEQLDSSILTLRVASLWHGSRGWLVSLIVHLQLFQNLTYINTGCLGV